MEHVKFCRAVIILKAGIAAYRWINLLCRIS